MIANYFFFPEILTIASLSLGVVLFFLLFFYLIGGNTAEGKRQGKLTTFYALGIFFITVGFTNYTANQGKMALYVEDSKNVYNLEVIDNAADSHKKETVTLDLRKVPLKDYLGCIIDKEKFDQIKKVTVYYWDDKSEKQSKDIEITNYNFRVVGLGGNYVIRF
jgi:hypothetical protein